MTFVLTFSQFWLFGYIFDKLDRVEDKNHFIVLSSKVSTQSNRHQLSLFNRKSPFDRELSYKFAFMRYFYPNLYAKIIKIQIGNPACID